MIGTPRMMTWLLLLAACVLAGTTLFIGVAAAAGSPVLAREAFVSLLLLASIAAVPLAAALLPWVRRSDILTGALALIAAGTALRAVTGDLSAIGSGLLMGVGVLVVHWSANVNRFREQMRHHPDELFEVLAVEERRRRGDRSRAPAAAREHPAH